MEAPERIGLVSDGMGRWALWNRHDNAGQDAVQYVLAARLDEVEARAERLEASLTGIKRAAAHYRLVDDKHSYYYFTADAALQQEDGE